MYGARYELPRLYNWMDAAVAERDIKAIRGKPDCKPLGKRRNTHVTIRKEDETYLCRLYRTDVVAFHKDGLIVVRLDGWASQTTSNFIDELLGVRCNIFDNRMWISCARVGSSEVGEYPLNTHGENLFRRNGHGDLEFQNAVMPVVHRINRAGANNVRKQFAAFRKYLVNTVRLRDNGFSEDEYRDVFGTVQGKPDLIDYPPELTVTSGRATKREDMRVLLDLALSTQAQDQYRASLMLVRKFVRHKYMGGITCKPNEAEVQKQLDEILLYMYRDECFEECQLEGGTAKRDAYAKFFSH